MIKMLISVWFVSISFLVSPDTALPDTQPVPQGISSVPDETAKEDSGKITLELKGMDILNVLKILAKKSGLNIITGNNVRGKVTIFLKDVDVTEALTIILETNDLAYEEQGNILKVMTNKDYEMLYGEKFHNKAMVKIVKLKHGEVENVRKVLEQIKSRIGKIIVDDRASTIILRDTPVKIEEMERVIKSLDMAFVTRVFQLDYAQAEEVATKVEEALTKNMGRVRVDERTNKIIVTDTSRKIEKIEELISAFDEKPYQVLIEAQIIEVVLSKDNNFGVNWEAFFEELPILSTTTKMPAVNVDLGLSSYTTVTGFGRGDIRGILQFLKTEGETNTLSTPRITVLNNQEAKILVGSKDVYITATLTQSEATTTSSPSVNFIDLGVTLSVTPEINSRGNIIMKIKPEITSFERYETLKDSEGREIAKVPVVTTTEAETIVMVKDGETILLAGLIRDRKVNVKSKVPFLSSVPLIGGLFTQATEDMDKTEIIILLTPRIIIKEEEIEEKEEAVSFEKEESIKVDTETEIEMEKEKEKEENKNTLIEKKPLIFSLREYQRLLYLKIHRSLKNNYSKEKLEKIDGKMSLSFIVDSKGNLEGDPRLIMEKEDGENSLLKSFVLRSLEGIFPFLPFPENVKQEQQAFSIPISFEFD